MGRISYRGWVSSLFVAVAVAGCNSDDVGDRSGGGGTNGPAMTVASALAFGNQVVGTTSAASGIAVTNSGTSALTVGTPTLTGANAGDFSISGNTCTGDVAPSGNCTISVTFAPGATGSRGGTLNIPSNAPSSPNTVSLSGTGVQALTRYDLANRCFVLKANGAYTVRNGSAFIANGADAAAAEKFYMRAAGLGRYLFYTSDRMLMTGSGTAVSAAATPSNGSDWTVDGASGVFAATTLDKALAVNASGQLVQGDTAVPLAFEAAAGCSVYPEMPVGIDGAPWKGNVSEPVIGFAEVHAHMAMGSEMSDVSGKVGPSAGGVMYGHAANRFGVVEALKSCEGPHGRDGELSPEWLILDGGGSPPQHDTVGWPTFVDWPQRDSQLHQQMYYKWVERVYKAGLRTMVVHGTNIEALCDVAKKTGNDKDTDLQADTDCTDMGVGMKQVAYLYDIEKYVDAQEGGPGKGWFRIVKDPTEARAVIAEGKMAVIPGLEFSNIFHCNVNYTPDDSQKAPNEAGTSACTKEDIDREIDEVWNAGVRAVFPYHDVDSALGGTGIFDSFALNLVGFYGTQGWWRTYDCEDGGEGDNKFFYDAGEYMYDPSFPEGFGTDPITLALMAATGGVLPVYPTRKRQCNARDVTPLGKYAIDKIMKKGFTLDIDHAEIRSKQYMLDEGAKLTPDYPMISGHGGHGGINNEQIKQIVRQGGIVYPSLPNGKDWKDFLNKLKPLWEASGTTRPLTVGYGADANGLHNLPGPRGAGTQAIEYPFTLFQGPGWGPQFAAAGIVPLKVELLDIPDVPGMPPIIGRSWNMDEDGMAHYGLVADIVEEIRIEGGEEATTALYRSAETYLQLWEQTLQASADARTKPSPP
jgi:hypothetical protein